MDKEAGEENRLAWKNYVHIKAKQKETLECLKNSKCLVYVDYEALEQKKSSFRPMPLVKVKEFVEIFKDKEEEFVASRG
ncbi:hypothetical protein QYM36_004584 [Artemia franciscana]|uniref:Uncharacterized protein n=1 Tax=Artemia franciscana TaxID=6661 RepID=A0AA88LCV5_ARTSF|nr:hypothetical protein QYM36_004584 [Artemia franciscana]